MPKTGGVFSSWQFFAALSCWLSFYTLKGCIVVSFTFAVFSFLPSTSHLEKALGMERHFTEGSLEGQVAQNMRLSARACPKYLQGYRFFNFLCPPQIGTISGCNYMLWLHFLLSCFSGSMCSSEIVDLTFFSDATKEFQYELQVNGRGSKTRNLNNQLEK